MASVKKKKEKIIPDKTVSVIDNINYFDKLGNNTIYVALVLVIFIAFWVFRDFIIGNKIYLFKDIGSDSINIYLPYWINVADNMRSEGLPTWSSNVGMGQNLFLLGQGNPFEFFLYLIGSENIPYGLIYAELFKIIFSCLFVFLYLRSLKCTPYVSMVGGLIFAFCGYMILGGSGWYHHSVEAVYASFFLFALERFIQKNQWYLVTLSSFFIGCWHSYFLLPYSILLIIYFTTRFFDENGFAMKKYFTKSLIIGVSFALGILMSSVFVVNMLLTIYNSPRVSGDASAFDKFSTKPIFELAPAMEYVSFIMRAFSNDILGNGNSFRGAMNYLEAPIVYIGLPCLLLFSQFFNRIEKYRKKIYIGISIFVLCIIIFPFFRYLFWGFRLDYFRTFSFFISLFLFYISIRALNKVDSGIKINLLSLGITLFICLFLLYYDYRISNQIHIDKDLRLNITLLLLSYSAILLLWYYGKFHTLTRFLFLFVLIIELVYASRGTISKRDAMTKTELKGKIGYNDYTMDATEYLNKKENIFFRLTKYYSSGLSMHRSINDAMIQHFKGSVSYSSFNQRYYIQFLQGVNAIRKGESDDVKWAVGLRSRPILQSLMSTKYALTKNNEPKLDTFGYKKIQVFGDVQLYENKTFIHLGVPYSNYISSNDFSKLSSFAKDICLFKAVVIDSGEINRVSFLQPFNLADTAKPFIWESYYSLADSLNKNKLSVSYLSNSRIEGNISTDRKQILFVSIPYDEGWHLKVNGKEQAIQIVDFGLIGIELENGENNISLSFEPPYMKSGISGSLTGIFIFAVVLIFYVKKNRANHQTN